jgi:predicted phage terminase large subunit-like protein
MGSVSDYLSPQEEIAVKQQLLGLLEEKARRHQEQLEREAWLAERLRCRTDLFYLLTVVMHRPDIDNPWLKARCEEVQANPNGYLDLWAREHYKSTIITFGKGIQDILASHGDDPLPEWGGRESTMGIFSHTRPIAKGFLRQIKTELETNQTLKDLFPDVLWQDPKKQSPKWSEDDGLVVKRKSNPKESTVEAWGIVDGQPTSKHFLILNYDDLVTKESVTQPDMIAKTTDSLALSYNLGAEGGVKRFAGSRYHFNDTYKTVMDRGTAKPRIHAATVDGTVTGEPVLLSRETLAVKYRDMGPYIYGCQMLLNPKGDETQGFKDEWLRYYDDDASLGTNRYILVDPASKKKVSSDYTAIWVIGLGKDQNYYALEIIRDRLNLTQRGKLVMELHRKWKPLQVRYEEYGLQADIEHIRYVQGIENYRFDIIEVGGKTAKSDRIKRLIPLFEQHRVYLPRSQHRVNYEGKSEDMVHAFINDEYKAFPVAIHDDLLDSLARITEPFEDRPELALVWPKPGVAKSITFKSEFA